MSMVQVLIIGIGLLIVLSSVDLSTVKKYINKQEQETDKPIAPSPVQVVVVNQKDELVSIVQKWQALKDACEKSKLAEASAKLDEIFPMLIKVEKS